MNSRGEKWSKNEKERSKKAQRVLVKDLVSLGGIYEDEEFA